MAFYFALFNFSSVNMESHAKNRRANRRPPRRRLTSGVDSAQPSARRRSAQSVERYRTTSATDSRILRDFPASETTSLCSADVSYYAPRADFRDLTRSKLIYRALTPKQNHSTTYSSRAIDVNGNSIPMTSNREHPQCSSVIRLTDANNNLGPKKALSTLPQGHRAKLTNTETSEPDPDGGAVVKRSAKRNGIRKDHDNGDQVATTGCCPRSLPPTGLSKTDNRKTLERHHRLPGQKPARTSRNVGDQLLTSKYPATEQSLCPDDTKENLVEDYPGTSRQQSKPSFLTTLFNGNSKKVPSAPIDETLIHDNEQSTLQRDAVGNNFEGAQTSGKARDEINVINSDPTNHIEPLNLESKSSKVEMRGLLKTSVGQKKENGTNSLNYSVFDKNGEKNMGGRPRNDISGDFNEVKLEKLKATVKQLAEDKTKKVLHRNLKTSTAVSNGRSIDSNSPKFYLSQKNESDRKGSIDSLNHLNSESRIIRENAQNQLLDWFEKQRVNESNKINSDSKLTHTRNATSQHPAGLPNGQITRSRTAGAFSGSAPSFSVPESAPGCLPLDDDLWIGIGYNDLPLMTDLNKKAVKIHEKSNQPRQSLLIQSSAQVQTNADGKPIGPRKGILLRRKSTSDKRRENSSNNSRLFKFSLFSSNDNNETKSSSGQCLDNGAYLSRIEAQPTKTGQLGSPKGQGQQTYVEWNSKAGHTETKKGLINDAFVSGGESVPTSPLSTSSMFEGRNCEQLSNTTEGGRLQRVTKHYSYTEKLGGIGTQRPLIIRNRGYKQLH